jgi:cytochrome P460
MKIAGIVAAGTLALTIHGAAAPEDAVDYPADYRQWAHVKSTLVGPQSPGFATNGGLHHFYANAKGMEGYRTGTFTDGAVLIDDLVEMKDASTPGVSDEGARKRLAVMVKDSRKFGDTGGWGFEIFKGDTQAGSLDVKGRAACFACHQKTKTAVFSQARK